MKLATLFTLMALAALSSTATTEKNRPLVVGQRANGKQRIDDDNSFSPIALCRQWNTLFRLTISVFATILGLTMNGYFVATFFVAKPVRKIGNVFLACVGLADLLITGGVMLISVVVLISGREWDTPEACQIVQTLVATSTYCYSLFFSLVALVARCRVNQTRKIFKKYLPALVGLICCMVIIFGFALALIGVYMGMDHDYCKRQHTGNDYFRLGTGLIHGFAFGVTVIILIASFVKLKRHNKGNGRYKRSYQYQRDMSLMRLNLFVFLLYVVFWTPHITIVNFYPDAADWLFYETAYLAIARSLISSTLYGLCNNIFGKAYSALFNYCWCKISIKNFRSRQARPGNGNFSRQIDLRTHILMQPSVNVIGPQDEL